MALINEHTTQPEEKTASKAVTRKEKMVFWFKRLGWAGFLFFLIKGIAWLVIFWLGKEAIVG